MYRSLFMFIVIVCCTSCMTGMQWVSLPDEYLTFDIYDKIETFSVFDCVPFYKTYREEANYQKKK